MRDKSNQFSENNLTLQKNKRQRTLMAKHPVEIIPTVADGADRPIPTDAGTAPPLKSGRFVRGAIRLILCGIAFAMTGCSKGYDPEPPAEPAIPIPNITIARLHDLCRGEAVVVREPLVVTGRVTTSDRAGNFYRTLCIEEEGAAVEIRLGTEESHNRYPIGYRLYLRLQGLCLERNRGILQAGPPAPASAGSAAAYFRSQALLDEYLFRGNAEEPLQGRVLEIGALSPELCGTLVLIPGLRYRPEEETEEETEENPRWEGYRRFEDETGAALHTYVSPYARFAEKRLSEGATALRGILQRIESGEYEGYILKLRDEKDCLD